MYDIKKNTLIFCVSLIIFVSCKKASTPSTQEEGMQQQITSTNSQPPGGYGSYASLLGMLFTTASQYKDFKIYPLQSEANASLYKNLQSHLANIAPGLTDFDQKAVQFTLMNAWNRLSSIINDKSQTYVTALAKLDDDFDSDLNDSASNIINAMQYDNSLSDYAHMFDSSPFPQGNKPMVVLINGNTFSSGDIFSAIFKDNNLAKIYGEDTYATGAGGANVIFYNQFQFAQETSIVPLFNENGLVADKTAPKLPNDMLLSFAWNRVIRPNCTQNSDCDHPEQQDDFIEKYYVNNPQNNLQNNVDVNGIPVDTYLPRTLEDITESDVQKQPLFIKIMQELEQ